MKHGCGTLLGLALLVAAHSSAAASGATNEKFVALPGCGSLPEGTVEYSTLGLRNQSADALNALTADERKEHWQLLFDGKSLQGWRGFQVAAIPGAWHVEQGAMVLPKWNEGDPTDNRGDIRTADEFGDFELRMQWAVTPGANSGIFFFAREGVAEAIYEGAPEMQILDDARHEDGAEPSHRAGGLYDLYPPRCNAVRAVGEYNDVRLVVRKGQVEHWFNGYRVLTYRIDTPQWAAQIAKSKFAGMQHFGKARRGHIAFQDHGDVVRFRNVRVRTLP